MLGFRCVPVAQLDRASDYGSEGCRFNSCQVRQAACLLKATVHPEAKYLSANGRQAFLHYQPRLKILDFLH